MGCGERLSPREEWDGEAQICLSLVGIKQRQFPMYDLAEKTVTDKQSFWNTCKISFSLTVLGDTALKKNCFAGMESDGKQVTERLCSLWDLGMGWRSTSGKEPYPTFNFSNSQHLQMVLRVWSSRLAVWETWAIVTWCCYSQQRLHMW